MTQFTFSWPNNSQIKHNMRKLLLVTGASSGVGLSLVKHFSDQYEIIAVARRLDRLEEAFSKLPRVTIRKADLKPDHGGQPADTVAGFGVWSRPLRDQQRRSQISEGRNRVAHTGAGRPECDESVNAVAPFMILQALVPGMKQAGFGRVINITSGAPLNCFPEFGAYSASKGALNAFTVTCAKECATQNIRINLMSPGPVRTEMAPNATMDPSACHATVDYLLNLPAEGPTGRFFWLGHEIPLFPNLAGIVWMAGKADPKFKHAMEARI